MRPLLLVCLLALGIAPGALALETRTLSHQGMEREYHVRAPAGPSSGPRPVMLVLHGGGRAGGREAAERMPLRSIVDQAGYITVFPEGVDSQWNDGRGVSFRRVDNTHVDDIGFLAAVMADVVRRDGGDPSRIFLVGASNGGMMTLRFACERAQQVAGIAVLIASLPRPLAQDCAPAAPVPTMVVNGTDDPIIPYDGGTLQLMGRRFGDVLSTDATVSLFRRINLCRGEPQQQTLDQPGDDTRVEKSSWTACQTGAPVVLYSVVGGGHTLPGMRTRAAALMGPVSQDINLADELVSFFAPLRRVP